MWVIPSEGKGKAKAVDAEIVGGIAIGGRSWGERLRYHPRRIRPVADYHPCMQDRLTLPAEARWWLELQRRQPEKRVVAGRVLQRESRYDDLIQAQVARVVAAIQEAMQQPLVVPQNDYTAMQIMFVLHKGEVGLDRMGWFTLAHRNTPTLGLARQGWHSLTFFDRPQAKSIGVWEHTQADIYHRGDKWQYEIRARELPLYNAGVRPQVLGLIQTTQAVPVGPNGLYPGYTGLSINTPPTWMIRADVVLTAWMAGLIDTLPVGEPWGGEEAP